MNFHVICAQGPYSSLCHSNFRTCAAEASTVVTFLRMLVPQVTLSLEGPRMKWCVYQLGDLSHQVRHCAALTWGLTAVQVQFERSWWGIFILNTSVFTTRYNWSDTFCVFF